MQVRRALTVAERGVISASADRRLWFGKNAYNPDVLVKLVSIFRTYFNYCELGEDGKTPAVRLGLARGPVAPEDIACTSRRSSRPGGGRLGEAQIKPALLADLPR